MFCISEIIDINVTNYTLLDRLAVVVVKRGYICTYLALEALPMPLGVEGHDRVLRNGSFAIAAAGGEHMLEVCPAVGKPIVLVEGGARQLLHAGSAAQETFLMPRLTHGLDGALRI